MDKKWSTRNSNYLCRWGYCLMKVSSDSHTTFVRLLYTYTTISLPVVYYCIQSRIQYTTISRLYVVYMYIYFIHK